jgi:hypothetical protein
MNAPLFRFLAITETVQTHQALLRAVVTLDGNFRSVIKVTYKRFKVISDID